MPPRKRLGKHGSTVKPVFSVHVSKLRLSTTKSQVYEVFKNYGNIVEIWFPTHADDANLTYTFAFVRYDTLEAAEKAVYEMNGWPMQGYKLRVQMASETVGYLSTTEREDQKNKKFGLEFSWMQELASLIGETECKEFLIIISRADVRRVHSTCFEGSKTTLELDALDKAAASHDAQKAKVKKQRPVSPEPQEMPEEENTTKLKLHKPHVKEFDFSKLSLEDRLQKHHLWAFIKPELWENTRFAPSKIGKKTENGCELTGEQQNVNGNKDLCSSGEVESQPVRNYSPSTDSRTSGKQRLAESSPPQVVSPSGGEKINGNQRQGQVSSPNLTVCLSTNAASGSQRTVIVSSPGTVSPVADRNTGSQKLVSPNGSSDESELVRGDGGSHGHSWPSRKHGLEDIFSAGCPPNFSLEKYLKSAGRGISRLPQK